MYRDGGLYIGIWTDSIVGTKDDMEMKATNNLFENFIADRTFENEDQPYMPIQANATYKEIWTPTTASAIWLLAELFKD